MSPLAIFLLSLYAGLALAWAAYATLVTHRVYGRLKCNLPLAFLVNLVLCPLAIAWAAIVNSRTT